MSPPDSAQPRVYQPRRPEATPLYEVLDLSRRLGFVDASVAPGLEAQYQDSAATLAALIRSLCQRSRQADNG